MKGYERFIVFTVLLSVASLFFEQAGFQAPALLVVKELIDWTLMLSVIGNTVFEIVSEKYRRKYFRENWPAFLFTVFFTVLFVYAKFVYRAIRASNITVLAAFVQNLFLALRIYS